MWKWLAVKRKGSKSHLEYDWGNDEKAEEYVMQVKKRLVTAAPSNEMAFTLYADVLLKSANCLAYI